MISLKEFNESLLSFLDNSPTPYHAIKNLKGMLDNYGFIELYEDQVWNLKEDNSYYVVRDDSSIIAWHFPKNRDDFIIAGSHSDSPNLKLKPNPISKEEGVLKFNVEPYGGIMLNPWFDRDLSLAGRVEYKNVKDELKTAIIDFKKPIAIIPSLAIHLDDKANKDKTINKQTDISPIFYNEGDFDFDKLLLDEVIASGYDDAKEVLSYELSFYDTQKASFVGVEKNFITSARLDNLLSVYVSLLSICSLDPTTPFMIVINNHEEVGSESISGASGNFFESVLKRVFKDDEKFAIMASKSMLISCDNAHATHPNFSSKHEPSHKIRLDEGVVIKVNANQRYATSSKTIAKVLDVANKNNIPLQKFVNRSDMGCGSTIGPLSATKVGIKTIDLGIPQLAMHSIRELCGVKDSYDLYKLLLALADDNT